jgi:hypothetical protein
VIATLAVLAASVVYGQAAADDAVITLNGFCSHAPRHGAPCRTVITREQFEKLTEALQPHMPPELRLKVATAYARMMKMAAAAEERGLDKTPAFEEEMRYARLQLLSQDLGRVLRDDADNVSDVDVEAYYQQNRSLFDEAVLARVFVPRTNRTGPQSEGEMLRVATELRVRAVRGVEPDELEKEAYAAAGIAGTVPSTRLENVHRATLPPTHERVMDLRLDEVSEVLSDPGGGHFLYKMIDRRTLSLQEARPQIRRHLSEQSYVEANRRFTSDVVLNDAYFAPSSDTRAPASRATIHRP